MMNPQRPIGQEQKQAKALLWPKMLAIFGGSFLLFFLLFLASELLTGLAEKSAANLQVGNQAQPIVIDPRIADELAKVLAVNDEDTAVQVSDPFIDRAGLSGAPGVAAAMTAQATQTSGGGGGKPNSTTVQNVTGSGAGVNSGGQPAIAMDFTKQRWQTYLEQAASNPDLKMDARIFAMEDLLPVGIVDGGSGPQEVMFISKTAGRTVSFPIGTMFFDGWLTEVRPEGVVFTFNDGRGTVRLRSWTRSVQSAG
jgi:hypothetical protein